MLIESFNMPVLLEEVINCLNIISDGIYVDGTFGQGGHSKMILSFLNKKGRLLGIDRDYSSVKIGEFISEQDKRFTIIYGKFSKLFKYLRYYNLFGKVNGILLDLGLSRLQLENPERGFSFMNNGPLDMRMDINCSGLSASSWLRKASLEKIIWVLKTFGEEKFAKRIAKSIVLYRKNKEVLTHTYELVKLITDSIPYYDKHKHPATRTFQAIRIYINNELEEIKEVLKAALFSLAPGGRLVVISFHSLEDRIVKHFIRQHSITIPSLTLKNDFNKMDRRCLKNISYNKRYKNNVNYNICHLKVISRIFPSEKEVKYNGSARSAVLRCVEKIVI